MEAVPMEAGTFEATREEDVDGLGHSKNDKSKEGEALSLTGELFVTGMDPHDFTPSDLIGGAEAGEEDIGTARHQHSPGLLKYASGKTSRAN